MMKQNIWDGCYPSAPVPPPLSWAHSLRLAKCRCDNMRAAHPSKMYNACCNYHKIHTHTHTQERRSPLNIQREKFNNSCCIVSSFISSDHTLSQALVWMNTQHADSYIINTTQSHTNRCKDETDVSLFTGIVH